MDKTIVLLKNFGFTTSEAKAYISLFQNGPSSGYELSKVSEFQGQKYTIF